MSVLVALLWTSVAVIAADPSTITISDLTVRLANSDGPESTQSLVYPTKLKSVLSAEKTDQISISFTLKGDGKLFTASAPMLVLEHSEMKIPSTLVFEQSSKGSYKIDLNLASTNTQELLKGMPGIWSATVQVGSYNALNVITYPLGSLELKVDSKPDFFTQYNQEENFKQHPEITHVMRPDPKMPNVFISQIFALVTVAPWLLLLGLWGSLGVNINNLFASSSSLIFGSGFIASLAAWVVLFYLYWTKFNLFELLGYGSVLSLITFIVGRQALVIRAQHRIGKSKQD